ncbi:peroxisome biogenesis factor 2 [Temnothorax curvispinosus]|uniref:RING-type E3 ubiquitin transferase (cysteine targeting) n=1 Tax=Temnothorax curvispinosus TaxID=300111 RepID=A0A6J1R466_9HYME|nr:peroxisome biogenesis factor 2 [Temnothorax curvispinosus]XP_024889388.1 peroxisome biogenesis factor 2 [Temnothorax curvispinosus]XP_024889389.1 peroxisome biogenesis factor 2 [Temnothorax curvispinosus]XP_024889390.1 peroxisome biogenesis factor 2 [Temnothorax curvispinosus]XP_024889392.1 peroxisome biogenesis factor 2 [Temnothorax curvispinosus]
MTPSPYVSRINQIDAAQLDTEIYKVLRNQAREIARYGAPGKIDKWQAEVDAVLKFFIWKFSLQRGSSTFGQRLLNLHYANINHRKSVLHLILSVLPQYLKDKLAHENLSERGAFAQVLKSLVDWTTNAINLLELVNLLFFLHRGVQPRVIEFLLGLSSQSITTHRPRIIGYSYMTRELLWHGLMELFTIGIPMINFHYLKHAAMRLWRRPEPSSGLFPVMNATTKCAYCYEDPILPSHAGCEHLFCYYCLQAHFTAMSAFHCPTCDAELRAEDMKRYTVASAPRSDDEESDDSFEKVDDG